MPEQPIPLVDVKAQFAPLRAELEARFADVLDGGQFIKGPHFHAFQQEAAARLGVKGSVGVANGTDALVLVLDALEIGPGDEVICPAFTFYATAEAIARRGAALVFADIDPATANVDPEDVAARVTERTRAIMPVQLESTADVRFAGVSTFSMTYDYEMVNGQAINMPSRTLALK